ncbi:ABC transporter substrate-binding protein [Kineosporia rhizophila]|uniref:ABC transporter substrate-binding protein n=1 Tax=Kineosporia TaxID=49184 RepID=UPI001E535A39|nr:MULTISPECIES: ABC transporter substrate-binding protein [Kineosporia]MCE0540806.1 ABC transporter substrate-binding protein [Kineosporia rhizophila]
MPVFKGARQLLECLELLTQRPRRREAPAPRGKVLSAQGIPLVCLKWAEDTDELVAGLARYLKEAEPRRVPHVVHRPPAPAGSPSDDVDVVADMLLRIARDLASGANAVGGRVRFSRFGLVHWLIRQDLGADRIDPHAVLFRRLRERELGRSKYATLFSDELPELFEAPVVRWARLARVVPPLWFRVRLQGRVPGVGREYRWLVRQPYLDPHSPGTVLGFAERLTLEQRRDEDPADVLLLLVEAFLSDVAEAYRRRFWRAGGARRTSYPVVLLDGGDDPAVGFELLRLVSEVRNHPQHGFDPVVFVAAAKTFPPELTNGGGQHPTVVRWAAPEAMDGYESWCRRLAQRSRGQEDWYLPISVPAIEVPPAAGADDEQYVALWHAANNARRFEVAVAPLWARPAVAPVAAAVLTATCLIGATATDVPGIPSDITLPVWGQEPGRPVTSVGPSRVPAETSSPTLANVHPSPDPVAAGLPDCVTDPGMNRFVSLHVSEGGVASCIGVSGQLGDFTESGSGIGKIDKEFATLNGDADQRKADAPTRAVITLVYVSSFRGNKMGDPVSQKLEAVAFLAAADEQNRQRQGDGQPIVRVLFANGGEDLSQRDLLVEQLKKAKAADRLTAVVGLDASTQATEDLILDLNAEHIPVVSATLTADGLAKGAANYFYVAAQNSEQAKLIGRYAEEWARRRQLSSGSDAPPRNVAIVCPADNSNLWSQTLLTALREEFRVRGWSTTVHAYVPDKADSGEAGTPEAMRQACGPDAVFVDEKPEPDEVARALQGTDDQLVVFAGRWQPFTVFLDIPGFDLDVIAADDVSSAVARRYENPEIDRRTFSYVSLAYCGKTGGADRMPYDGHLELADLKGINAHIDSHAPLALAAAHSVIDAAAAALEDGQVPTPEQVQEQLRQTSGEFGAGPGALNPEAAVGEICRISVLQAYSSRKVVPDPLMERLELRQK